MQAQQVRVFFPLDFIMSTAPIISQSLPPHLIAIPHKNGARVVPVLISLLFGLWIGRFYSSQLLSSLVAKDYESPIDSIEDLLRSQLLLYVADGTVIQGVLDNHPRADVRKLMKEKGQRFPFRGLFPKYVLES